MNELWRRLRMLFHRDRFDRDLEDEIAFHLDMKARENREAGLDADEAHFAARRQFGNATLLAERSREMWGWSAVESFLRDLKYASRLLRRAPGFTVLALVILALGVGVNTAMFSVLRAVLLRPLPYRDPGRLMMVWQVRQGPPTDPQLFRPQRTTPPARALELWRERSGAWESLAGYTGQYLSLTGGGPAERASALLVTANLFPTLGVTPARGRNFLPDEEHPGNAHSVILSEALWRTRFGGDPAILGRRVRLDGETYVIVGVLPAGFEPVLPTVNRRFDLYLPLVLDATAGPPPPVRVIGRLRRDAALPAAQAEMEAIVAELSREMPRSEYTGVRLTPVADDVTRDARSALLALAGAVACVLLIVCVNLASLMLARAAAARREMSIRAALGASRWRLARQLLAMALLLGVLGGGAGTLLARWIVDLIRTLHPGHLPRIEQAAPDSVVFLFGLAASVIAGLLFGVLPAVSASRTNVDAALRQRGPHGAAGRDRLRGALIAAEVALALVLATCAGLLARSYLLLKAVEPGFAGGRVLTMQVTFTDRAYNETRRTEVLSRVLECISAVPAVESAGAASWLPLAFDMLMGTDVQVKGHALDIVNTLGATPGYFQAAGIPVVAGRAFREGDRSAVVVNEALCRRYGLDPGRVVGEQIRVNEKLRQVAGVVGDVRDLRLERPAEPQAFLPYAELPTPFVGFAVRTSTDPMQVLPAIRAAVQAVDPDLPLARIETMEDILSGATARPRFNLTLLGTFASLALALAATGVYGVIAYLVSQRRNEIGVRVALGAQSGAVMRLVLAKGMGPVAAGLAAGLAGAFAATRLLRGLLYGIGPADPVSFGAAAAVLAAVALAACWLPARRATKIDPMEALRYE